MDHDAAPRTLAAPARGVLAVSDGSSKLEQGDRDRLISELRAGRGPSRLHVEAVVFRQDAAPNRAFVRFKAGLLRSLAKSFVGAPFLRDHEQRDLAAVGGSILSSEFHGAEGHGEIRQTLEVVKPWAIEAALDGTMSRFSIGWNNTGPVLCTECEAPLFATVFGAIPSCSHMPGDEIDARGGGKRFVEALVTGAEGVECSAVTVPAVRDTGVEAIRAALSAHRRAFAQVPQADRITVRVEDGFAGRPDELAAAIAEKFRRTPKEKNMSKLCTMLGISATADDAAVEAAVSRLTLDIETTKSLLAAEREARATSEKRLGEYETQLAAQKKADQERAVAGLEATLKKKSGNREKPLAHMRKLAALSMELAAEYVADLPQEVPLQALPREEEKRSRGVLSDSQRKINAGLGISDAEYLKRNPIQEEV